MTAPKHNKEPFLSRIQQILETKETYGWEETSLSYALLSAYALQGDIDVVLLYNFENRVLVDHTEQYLSQFSGIKITEKINVDESEFFSSPKGISKLLETITQTKKIVIHIFDSLYFNNIYKKISKLSKESLTLIKFLKSKSLNITFPFWRKIGSDIREFALKNINGISNLICTLHDMESCEVLTEIIRAASTHDYYRLHEGNQVNKYFDCYKHITDEVFINCGAGTGDTIVKYFENRYDCKKIYAIEGSDNIYNNLLTTIEALPENIKSKIRPINKFIGLEKNSILSLDSLFGDKGASLINMDIEGAEKAVLEGGLQLIKKHRPVLAICAYHKASDLLEIPNLLLSAVDDYELYLRKYKGYEPNALNEYVYYFVPKERSLDPQ